MRTIASLLHPRRAAAESPAHEQAWAALGDANAAIAAGGRLMAWTR